MRRTMKFLIYLVVFFLLFNGFTANKSADSLIQDSCKKASREWKAEYFYKFCIASINENPESQKVRNIDELIVVATNNAISNMTNVKEIMEKILKERKYKNKLNAKLLRDCVKLYSKGYDSLTKSLEYIKMRKYEKAFKSIHPARAYPRVCEMGFNDDNKQKSPVRKENDVLFDIVEIALTFNFDAHIATKL